MARDITERRHAERALARSKDVAEAASRELEAFSYSVAHDLRAPLRRMSGFAQLLLDGHGESLDAEGKDWLHEIFDGARNMDALIDALLSLSRVTRVPLNEAPVDLSAIARSVTTRLEAGEPTREVDVVIQEPLATYLDPTLARVLVENLLGNAWKFTSKVTGTRAKIEMGAEASVEGATTFFVSDNGAGFDMTFANRLFAPFQRLHSVQDYPGTGIGLATVQRIVKRHGGSIWAEGAVGRGATFRFSFPRGGSGVTR